MRTRAEAARARSGPRDDEENAREDDEEEEDAVLAAEIAALDAAEARQKRDEEMRARQELAALVMAQVETETQEKGSGE